MIVNNKKIALVLPDLRIGGAEKMTVNLANCLIQKGHTVHIVLLQKKGGLIEDLNEKVQVIDLHAAKIRHIFFPLALYIKKNNPDAIIANMWPITILSILSKSFSLYHCSIIAVEHTTWGNVIKNFNIVKRFFFKLSMFALFPLASKIITVSENSRFDLIRVSGVNPKKTKTIYNPVIQSFPQATQKTYKWFRKDTIKLLTVGTLKKVKDHLTLLKALSILSKNDQKYSLIILGDGDERDRLEAYIEKESMRDSIYMPGFIKDTKPYYDACDLFVLSSITEGLGNVIIEALASGKPVVSTDCPSGPREILGNKDGEYGFLAEVGNPHDLANKITLALNTEFDRNKLIERTEQFSIEYSTTQYLDTLFPTQASSQPTPK